MERTDQGGDSARLGTYPVEAVIAVFHRAPLDGGGYEWLPQPSTETW
ncbi:hypothetical protein ABZ281_15100 [Streptomyces sp. NPDC006265]